MDSSKEQLYALTSLRFFGSLAVFFYHAFEICRPGSPKVVFGSASAVSLFFVLSGFILVYIYSGKMKELGYFGFVYKRLIRLWPLHIACLALSLFWWQSHLFRWPADQLFESREFLGKLSLHALLLHSWATSSPWIFEFNGVSWFVATEFGLSLLFPLLCRFQRSRFWLVYLIIVAFHLFGLYATNSILANHPEWRSNIFNILQCNPFFRLTEFASGMLVGFIFLSGFRLANGSCAFWLHFLLEMVAFTLFFLSLHLAPIGRWMLAGAETLQWTTASAWLNKGGSSLLPSMLMIWVLASSRGPIGLMLSQPLLVYLGKISFAFFMIHSLVLFVINHFVPAETSPNLLILCGLMISLAAAALLNMLIENPIRNGLTRLVDRKSIGETKSPVTSVPVKQSIFPVALTCLVALPGFFALWLESNRNPNPDTWVGDQLVFSNEAILHFVEAEAKEEQLEFTLVWEKLPTGKGHRFTHIIETDTKFRNGSANPNLFPSGRITVERLSIPLAELTGAKGVAIGFFRTDKVNTHYYDKKKSVSDWRLTIYDCETGEVPELVKKNTKARAIIQ